MEQCLAQEGKIFIFLEKEGHAQSARAFFFPNQDHPI